jgi:hypothetical protein
MKMNVELKRPCKEAPKRLSGRAQEKSRKMQVNIAYFRVEI